MESAMIDRESVMRQLAQHMYRAENIKNDWMDCVSIPMLRGALALLKADQTYLLQKDEEIARLNRELDAMNRLSEMQMEALQEAEHDRTD